MQYCIFLRGFPPDSCCPFVLRVLMILLTCFDESVLQPAPQQANIAKENGLFADDLPSTNYVHGDFHIAKK